MRILIAVLCVVLSGCTFTVQDTPELRAKMGEPVVPVPPLPVEEQCLDIKANINNAGQHIYHLPGMRNYNQTLIDKEGESFFCTEEEAAEAGFRKAKN